MRTANGAGSYCRMIINRAFQDSRDALDPRRDTPFKVIYKGIGLLFVWVFLGGALVLTQLKLLFAYSLAFPIMLILFFLFHLIAAPAKIYLEQLNAYSQLEQEDKALRDSLEPRLAVTFEKSAPYIQIGDAVSFDGKSLEGRSTLLRIAVKSLSLTTLIENVRVELEHMQPEVLPFFPVAIHMMHDNPPLGEPHIQSFNLNPGETKYFDLISRIEAARSLYNGSKLVWPAVPGIRNLVPNHDYEITVHVTAANCREARATYLTATDAQGNFYLRPRESSNMV